MKILMLKDDLATTDGFAVAKFLKGEEYEVREFTGCNLINRGSAKFLTDEVKNEDRARS